MIQLLFRFYFNSKTNLLRGVCYARVHMVELGFHVDPQTLPRKYIVITVLMCNTFDRKPRLFSCLGGFRCILVRGIPVVVAADVAFPVNRPNTTAFLPRLSPAHVSSCLALRDEYAIAKRREGRRIFCLKPAIMTKDKSHRKYVSISIIIARF